MHHAHRTIVVLVHSLVIVSMLASSLGGWSPANAAGLSFQEITISSEPSALAEISSSITSATTNAPLAAMAEPKVQDPSPYPAPGSEEAPPPEPLPQELAQDGAESAATILSEFPAERFAKIIGSFQKTWNRIRLSECR